MNFHGNKHSHSVSHLSHGTKRSFYTMDYAFSSSLRQLRLELVTKGFSANIVYKTLLYKSQ